jgi:hypothetical protein
MFGYIQPLKPELKVKEYEAFRGYYCGLCKAIKEKYTHAARFMLNYDCAVLSLLLSSMSEQSPSVTREKCIASPLKKKTIVHSEEAAYAAAVNILLGCGKIRDTAIDDHKVTAHLLCAVYRGVFKRAQKDYPALAEVFGERMKNLRMLEQQKSGSIDAVSSEFAQLLAAVFSFAPYPFVDEAAQKALWHLGYNLGRWLYIADAVDDLVKDHQTGSYNVFLQREYHDPVALQKDISEEAAFNMRYSLAQACQAYELLDIKRDKPLLDNIMYLGLAKKTEDVLKGEGNGSVSSIGG